MAQSLALVVTAELEDASAFSALVSSFPEKVEILDVKRIEGGELITIIVTLSAVTLRSVAALLTELIRSKQHVSIKCDGIEIVGVSEKGAERILAELLDPRLSITIESTKIEVLKEEAKGDSEE